MPLLLLTVICRVCGAPLTELPDLAVSVVSKAWPVFRSVSVLAVGRMLYPMIGLTASGLASRRAFMFCAPLVVLSPCNQRHPDNAYHCCSDLTSHSTAYCHTAHLGRRNVNDGSLGSQRACAESCQCDQKCTWKMLLVKAALIGANIVIDRLVPLNVCSKPLPCKWHSEVSTVVHREQV